MRVFIKSVIAGMLIGIGCVVFLMCPDRIVGSFLFSFGLFSILNMAIFLTFCLSCVVFITLRPDLLKTPNYVPTRSIRMKKIVPVSILITALIGIVAIIMLLKSITG